MMLARACNWAQSDRKIGCMDPQETADADASAAQKIGLLVEFERRERGMSRSELARAVEVDLRTITSIEKGRKWPRDTTQAKIEGALGWRPGTMEYWRSHPGAIGNPPPIGQDATVHVPIARVDANFTGALEQLRAANIAVVAERMARLPAEDIARVQDLVDELGRARFPDWDDDAGYDLAWNRRSRLTAEEEDEAIYDLALPHGVSLGPVDELEPEIAEAVLRRRQGESEPPS